MLNQCRPTEVVLQKYLIRLALKFIHNKKETKVTNSHVNYLSVSLKSSNPLMYLQLLVLLELSIFRPSCLYKLIFYQLPIFRTNLLPLILWKHPKNNLMPLQLVLNPKLHIPTSTLNIELIFWHTQWIAMLNHGLNHQFKSNLPETSQVQLLGWAASFNCLPYVHHYNPWLSYLLPHFWSSFLCFQGVFFSEKSFLMHD